jgi:hypothetical protein
MLKIATALGLLLAAPAAHALTYPGDCNSATLRSAASKNGCAVNAGNKKQKHLTVTKDGKFITSIPHSVKANGTCRSIIKAINDNCS